MKIGLFGMWNDTAHNMSVYSGDDKGGVVIERPFSSKEITLTQDDAQQLVKAIIQVSNSSDHLTEEDSETPPYMFNVLFAGHTPVGIRTHRETLPFLPVVGMHFEWINLVQPNDDAAQELIPMKVTSVEACKDACDGCKTQWLFRVVLEMNEDQES